MGSISLGESYTGRQNLKGRKEFTDDGAYISYSVEYDEEAFESWLRPHEIHLPLNRLKNRPVLL